MQKKDKVILLLLTCFSILMIILITPNNTIYGSTTDWFSQHIQISDSLRHLLYEKQTLFPDFFTSLGGGQNVYAFSYYGLFRLDLLVSLFLPFIAMKDIIIGSMILCIIASVNLCYIWIRKHQFPIHIALFCALSLCFSSFLFHTHRQIIFVNYMPFLFLALFSIDYYFKNKKTMYFIISIIMIITHSYFFSVSALFVLFLYILYQCHVKEIQIISKEGKTILWDMAKACFIAISICAVLLLPTALVMLEHTKDVASASWNAILMPSFTFQGLLYNNYGCGLTLISWILLCFSLFDKKTRGLALFFLCLTILPIVAFLLNGGLYVRYKVLIPFLPLLLLLIAQGLSTWKKNKIKFHPLLFILLLIPLVFNYQNKLIWFDFIVCFLILIAYRSTKQSIVLTLALCTPFGVSYANNKTETFVTKKNYQQTQKRKEHLRSENKKNEFVRSDDLRSPLTTSNMYLPFMQKTTMYTSITNTKYNDFYYDVMKNAIPIRNRVACLAQENTFFQGLMGVRYLYSESEHIPAGYQVIEQKGKTKVLENTNVFPLAYTTSDVYSEKHFDTLAYPYNLDTIYNNAIINDTKKQLYQSKIQKMNFDLELIKKSDNLIFFNQGEDLRIESTGVSNLQIRNTQNLKDNIILIQFTLKEISNHHNRDTSITINGVKNKLSSKKASYPNKNNTFTYILSSAQDWNTFDITFSDGNYTLSKLSAHHLPYEELNTRQVNPLTLKKSQGKEVLKGEINVQEKDSYFITSLPYQKGYSAYIDGKEIPIKIVNKAFVGFPILTGKHNIRICFTPPGKKISLYLSSLGILLFIMNTLHERKKVKR